MDITLRIAEEGDLDQVLTFVRAKEGARRMYQSAGFAARERYLVMSVFWGTSPVEIVWNQSIIPRGETL